jgi:hypothetical protein
VDVIMLKTLLLPVLALSLAAPAMAADYPAALRGRYDYQGGSCQAPALVIEQAIRTNDVDAACTAKAITAIGPARFTAIEQCNREGRTWTQTASFGLQAGMLRLSEGQSPAVYTRCAAPVAAAPVAKTAAAAKVMNCKVPAGQAGVTTYLDAALKRSGNSVRDFDDYTFRATGKIVVNKTDVLVGQLIRADGSVSEPRSWALADEWECQ